MQDVSVVMPVYNGERFVGEAIESILGQTYRDLELIVIDDGSSDRTPDVIAHYARRDARVIAKHHPVNRGFAEALNTGCREARGTFIARMDADDVSLPQRFERQIAYLRAHPDVGAVGSAMQIIDDRGVRGRVKSYPLGSGQAAWSMLFFNSLAHPSVMMRRTLLEAAGWYPAGCVGGTEDYAVFLGLSWESRIANLPEVLLLYRVWGGNMTQTKWDAQEGDAVRLLRAFARSSLGIELTADDAIAMRGLARNHYPRDARAAARLGSLIEQLVPRYVDRFDDSPFDVREIRTDAGVRLWLLSALALRRASPQSLSLAAKAFTTSPTSLGAFVAKVGKRLNER